MKVCAGMTLLFLLSACGAGDEQPARGQSSAAPSVPLVDAAASAIPPPDSAAGRASREPTEVDDNRSLARDVQITVLSTMLADSGIGEWGFSALVRVDGRAILFDAGKFPDTVLRNARALDIDLSQVEEVVLSHHHNDHIGGLVELRRVLRERNPRAMSRVHVAAGMFRERRRRPDGPQLNRMLEIRETLGADGVEFAVHSQPRELAPGVWLTGPVPRVHMERNYTTSRKLRAGSGWQADFLPESQALVIDTAHGLVVVAGCGHAGLINTLDHARSVIRETRIHAALGGFHLLSADDEHLRWTGRALARVGLEHFMGAHCTGIEAVFRIREHARLERATAVVGAVGARFTAGRGLEPGVLAR